MSLYIAKALKHIGYEEHPVKFVLVGDEEGDHIGNNADEIITRESEGCLCGFNMEPGDMQNRLVVGRKSQHTFFVSINGVGGHAGNDVLTGRNALVEAAHKITAIAALTDLEAGSSVTPSVISAGTTAVFRTEIAKFVPYNESAGITALHTLLNDTAARLKMPEFGKVHRGGVSDAGNIMAAGVPVLDGRLDESNLSF